VTQLRTETTVVQKPAHRLAQGHWPAMHGLALS
jgi:hypothetical protein